VRSSRTKITQWDVNKNSVIVDASKYVSVYTLKHNNTVTFTYETVSLWGYKDIYVSLFGETENNYLRNARSTS
jgi:hypothetical protein